MNTVLQFICVTTDAREHQLWVTAAKRHNAVKTVLNAIPEGWTARLLEDVPVGRLEGVFDLAADEAREISLSLAVRRNVH